MVTAHGYNGTMTLSGEWVLVEHTRWERAGQPGVLRRIAVGDIAGLELNRAGLLRNGHLRIIVAGGSTAPPDALDVTGDEGTVIFTHDQQHEFEALNDAIEDARHG